MHFLPVNPHKLCDITIWLLISIIRENLNCELNVKIKSRIAKKVDQIEDLLGQVVAKIKELEKLP